jgi:hypothetical protein
MMNAQDWMATAALLLSTMSDSRHDGIAPGPSWDDQVRMLLAQPVDQPAPAATDERWHAYALAGAKALGEIGAGEVMAKVSEPDDVALELATEVTRFADAMMDAAVRQAATGKGTPIEGA